MNQLSFIEILMPERVEAPKPPTPWEILQTGTKDFDWPEERARILNERKMK